MPEGTPQDTTKELPRSALKIGAKLKGQATTIATLTRERDEARTALAGVTTERDQLKAQVLTPDAKDASIKELTLEIRTGKHKAKFSELAQKAGMNAQAVDGEWDLHTLKGGYKLDADVPDDTAIQALVDASKQNRGYVFGKGDTTAGDGKTTPPPPPGRDRGGNHDGKDGILITREQLMDPKFMLDPGNKDKILLAAKEKRFRD